MRISQGEDVACDPNRANGEEGLFQRVANPASRAKESRDQNSLRARGAPARKGSLEDTRGYGFPSDPAILAPKSVGSETGNPRFREWESTLQAEGQGPAGDASLFGGPLPAPRTQIPRPVGTQPRGRRSLRQLSGLGRREVSRV